MTGVIYELDMNRTELHDALGQDLNIMTLNVVDQRSVPRLVPLVVGLNQYDGKGVYLSMETGDKKYSGPILELLGKMTGRKISVVSETTMS